jgi:phosphatidylglycerophosphatase C
VKEVVLLDFDSTVTMRDTTRFLFIELIKLRPWKVFGATWFFIRMLLSSDSNVAQRYKNRAIGHLLAGLSDSDMSEALLSFSDIVSKIFRPILIQKIKEWNKSGVLILIVTASPSFAIDKCVSDLPVFVVGTSFTKVSDRYSGQLESPNCYGEEKVRCIENWVEKRGFSANYIEAWSDHFSDYPMLKMADKRYWIGGEKLQKLVMGCDPEAKFVHTEE